MTLENTYLKKIGIANENQDYTEFVFVHKKQWYIVKWVKNMWEEPIKINKL
jgi:predicted nucleotidyltransferase